MKVCGMLPLQSRRQLPEGLSSPATATLPVMGHLCLAHVLHKARHCKPAPDKCYLRTGSTCNVISAIITSSNGLYMLHLLAICRAALHTATMAMQQLRKNAQASCIADLNQLQLGQ